MWCQFQLKDEKGQLMGVDTSKLLIANSGNDLPVRNGSAAFYLSHCISRKMSLSHRMYVNNLFIFKILVGY